MTLVPTVKSYPGAILVAAALSAIMPGTAHAEPNTAANDLCSKEGLMRLVPQFRSDDGTFKVPDPTTDLDAFLAAQQGLSNAIEMILTQANMAADPYRAAIDRHDPLTFGREWRAAEIGIQTDGHTIRFADPAFAAYGGQSFLEGLSPIGETQGVFYSIEIEGRHPALIYPMPTALPCVNRLILAAGNTVGSWPMPTYALGSGSGEDAFLIVNICQDLGTTAPMDTTKPATLRSNAMLIVAFQWADTEDMARFRTGQKTHRHGQHPK
ncbi:hypothetical protein [Roseibium sp. RKSG952]|uniref:hypothetical protein n=1 Tax=Roseibium sp. RKSG952 TaxID=2529384 RepID=UPI0012BBE9AC|nr:hypothetical protein [Roseibium sp. RKSG952]MTH96604.1 hypothetical protein [Roseibium sp. RKSG952]